MSTSDSQEWENEIRQIMLDRIATVSQELHEKGLRWGDMFTEEDNRAIETFTIETVGESAQEAAEREARKREIYEMRMEMLAKYSNRKIPTQTQDQTKTASCEESEIVPDDPIPQSAAVQKDPDKNKQGNFEEEPIAGSSRMGQSDRDYVPRQYQRNNMTMEYERRQHYHRRSHMWRSNRMYHTSTNGNWRHSHNENSANHNWHRPYYGRGGWKGHRDRHLHGHGRWADERSHNHESEEQDDRPHSSFSKTKRIVRRRERTEQRQHAAIVESLISFSTEKETAHSVLITKGTESVGTGLNTSTAHLTIEVLDQLHYMLITIKALWCSIETFIYTA